MERALSIKGAAGRHLTAAGLQHLLRSPLARLNVSTPSIEDCEKLVGWLLTGPIETADRKVLLSDRPSRNLTALRNSLGEAEEYWAKALAAQRSRDAEERCNDGMILGALSRLRTALDECEPLLRKVPLDFKDNWEDAAVSLGTVFKWVINRSGTNVHSGWSKGGPSFSFVYAGLRELEWVRGSSPTEDAVLQFLKRYRKTGDISL